MTAQVARVREGVTARAVAVGNRLVPAATVHMIIRLEALARELLDASPHAVRAAWGMAARQDLDALSERIAGLDDRLRQLESDRRARNR